MDPNLVKVETELFQGASSRRPLHNPVPTNYTRPRPQTATRLPVSIHPLAMPTSPPLTTSPPTSLDPILLPELLKEGADNGPESYDSFFIDDDDDIEKNDFDDGSFTMIDGDDIPSSVVGLPDDGDDRQHLRRQFKRQEPNTTDKMKNKIVSFWHSVKYGWTIKPKSNFNKKKPIFLLSKCYDCRSAADIDDQRELELMLIAFRQDFTTRIWLTYRQGFTAITDTQYTSDSGWGCMIRSGQMLLAQALLTHFLGRDYNMFTDKRDSSLLMHREIISWFSDQPVLTSPFSIHRLVNIGKSVGRKAGDWYGPASVATILEKASKISNDVVPLLKDVCVYVAPDCTIYKQDVIDLATSSGSSSSPGSLSEGATWKSVIILIPIRLGTDSLNSIYIPCLKGLFVLDSFLGIMGGKPKHSLYFIGFQDNKLIHLDPHYIQDKVDTNTGDFSLQTYHCVYPRKISFSSVDPSCSLGFYCRTRADFEEFLKTVEPYLIPPDHVHGYPMFVVSNGSRSDNFIPTQS